MPLRHSVSSSSRKRAPSAPLPARLQLLEQLSLSLSASKVNKRDVRYELTVSHAASGVSWRYRRSFEEYHAFQQRLLAVMKHGHFCQAECPYLYTFVKSYFPKPALFGSSSACLIEKRCDALAQCLSTLQKFVANRANLSCSVVSGDVASEVIDFVVGDVLSPKHPLHQFVQQQQLQLQQLQQLPSSDSNCFTSSNRSSCLSFVSSTSDESDEAIMDACACTCTICHSSLDGEAFADSKAAGSDEDDSESDSYSSGSGSSRGSSSSLASRCSSLSYTTTLACGHVFHDECIVPKLNEKMACPACGVALAP